MNGARLDSWLKKIPLVSRGFIGWILDHIDIHTADQPLGPVVLDLQTKRYLVIGFRFGAGFYFSIDLRD